MKFAPINIVTGYSFLQSGLTIDKIVRSARENEYFGVGICDNGVLYGVPSFISECTQAKLKTIVGMRVNLNDSLCLYAKNEDGYLNLVKLTKLISEDKLDLNQLSNSSNGLVAIIETNYGEFKNQFAKGMEENYLHELAKLSALFDEFYLGLEVTTKEEFKIAQKIRTFAKERTYNTIAFPRIQYEHTDDAIVLTMVNAIDHNEQIETKSESGQSCFQKNEFYQKLYTKEEIELTNSLIEQSSFELFTKRGEMLHFIDNPRKLLEEKVFAFLNEHSLNDINHLERAKYEIEVISSMGYEDYFLLVADYINYAKTHNILVGPGRGSAAGSLVSYSLGITEVDPLTYNLQFERFLNKARKNMPDIDVDFMDTRRDEVVQYLRDKYGENRVSCIATFQTIKAKQALRDIGRIYNIPTQHIDMLSKSITDKMTLREAYKQLGTFRNLVDSDKYFLEIVTLASKIENLPRQAGMHAAGVVLNDTNIDEQLPVTIDLSGHLISQYEKDYLEKQNFLKMDFLSLRNLTTIDVCLKLLKRNKNIDLSMYDIDYTDPKIFTIINKCYTAGIFQLESTGMKNAIKILHIKTFEDVVELLALFRPGPMDSLKDYASRKEGKVKQYYLSENVKKVLAPTYGVLVYQEQITSIAQVMAGFTIENADLFRAAVSKKNKEKLLSAKEDFIKGSVKNGYKEKDALLMFNNILKFANYGLNKSHAVVYAIIACRMAFLKYYYPLEFYTALLITSSGANDAKFPEYVSELNKRGLKIYLPNINESSNLFEPKEDGLLFPLSFIHGVNIGVASSIIDERNENGPYKDFFDFVKRMFPHKISLTVIEKLINAGCFDTLFTSRERLRKTAPYAISLSELMYSKDGQLILDDTIDSQVQYFSGEDDPLNNLSLEYEALGIMLSDNPLKYHENELKENKVVPLDEAKTIYGNIAIAGIISSIKTIKTRKNNTTMAFIKVFDETGELEVTIFPNLFTEKYAILEKNSCVLIKGRYDHGDKESFVANDISKLGD